ncbi:MAG: DHH family phosphoesterase [Planctomycetota bacterium]|jgi:nanoRNase/pAp phosphatase (c-di-AMP/oligoRNAs hydrolase)
MDLDNALEGLRGRSKALILTHNHPDPDAIASAESLRLLLTSTLGFPCTIGYGGIVGRAENRAMVNLLDIAMTPVRHLPLGDFDVVALVDTQPETGNNNLPEGKATDIVIDHHPRRTWSHETPWVDIREHVGATSSILYEYLSQRRIPLDIRLATILLYGILSDTMDLGRGATETEYKAYLDLLPKSDHKIMAQIRVPNLSFKYYRAVTNAIENAVIYGSELVSVFLEELPYPELPAEMADFFIRAQGVHITFCAGLFGDDLYLSLRTQKEGMNAGELIEDMAQPLGHVGGHEHMAGGMVDLVPKENAPRLVDTLCRRLCSFLNLDDEAKRFIDRA